MFVSRSSLFVAVALLALSAIAEADQACKNYTKGYIDPPTFAVPVTDVPLPSGYPEITYSINSGGCPTGTGHVGTWLKACDEGIAPIVNFIDLNNAEITRPNPVAVGVVHGKIFCLAGAVSSAEKLSPFASLGASNVPHLQASVQH